MLGCSAVDAMACACWYAAHINSRMCALITWRRFDVVYSMLPNKSYNHGVRNMARAKLWVPVPVGVMAFSHSWVSCAYGLVMIVSAVGTRTLWVLRNRAILLYR